MAGTGAGGEGVCGADELTILALTAKPLVVSLPALSAVERVEPRSD